MEATGAATLPSLMVLEASVALTAWLALALAAAAWSFATMS
jgi:hypothetical protein